MKRVISTIIIILVMFLLLPSCSFFNSNSNSEKVQEARNQTKQSKDNFKEPLQESASLLYLCMMDELAGWALNNDMVFHTLDGGKHWDAVTPDMDNLVKTGLIGYFYDANTGWIVLQEDGLAVGNQGVKSTTIFFTSNGGKGWKKSIISSYNLGTDISFIDSKNAWILLFQDLGLGNQKAELYRTNNAGESWVKVSDCSRQS